MNQSNFNGYRGEQRTKSIVSDNFILLTTSIDENGADMLVRRINDDNPSMTFLNTVVIQSKYIKDLNKTYINIKKEYIQDKYGIQNFGFCLMIHSGEYNCKKVIFFNFNSIFELINEDAVRLSPDGKYYCFKPDVINKNKYDYTEKLCVLNEEIEEMLDRKKCFGYKRKNENEFEGVIGIDIYNAYERINNILESFHVVYESGGVPTDLIMDSIRENTFEKIGDLLKAEFYELQSKVNNCSNKS